MSARGGKVTGAGRIAVCLILALSMTAVLIYYIGATRRIGQLSEGRDNNLVGTLVGKAPQGRGALKNLSALSANPLDQRAVNGAIAARARATGNINRALQEIGLLRQLGWRNNNAMQNLLWRGGMTGDLPLVMDTLDALLRRQKLLSQLYPILNLMTTDSVFRGLLTARLAGRPSWRAYYFLSASDLTLPEQIEGRYLVMRDIQRRGDRLTRNEIAPILPKLIAIGQTPRAFELWRTQAGVSSTPLADVNFALASEPLDGDALPISFEWQLTSGNGYVVDASRDERGSFASIDWNGRGAPIFMSQRTTGRAGRYRLTVNGDAPLTHITDRIGLRLVCPDGKATDAQLVASRGGRQAQFVSETRVACDYPDLQLYGLAQAGTNSASAIMRSIRMERMGP